MTDREMLELAVKADGLTITWSGSEVQKWIDENIEEMTTDRKWRELALQFDRHRMQAMALIRAVASGKADVHDCVEFAKAPPPEDGATSNKYRAELYVSALVETLEELVDLMEDIRQGEYTPDSFTTQPARIALAAYHKQGGDL